MKFQSIKYEKKNGVATITKDNPETEYGMSKDVLIEAQQALNNAKNDTDVRVIILTTTDNAIHNYACVVNEHKETCDFPALEFRDLLQVGHKFACTIETLEKPVIGVASGGAIGGGLETLLACDFIIAAETATFMFPEITCGIIVGWGTSQRLPRMVGMKKAKYMLMTGEEIDGREAAQIGLVTKAVALNKVEDEVKSLCDKLTSFSPTAMNFMKQSVNKAWDTDYRSGLDYEIEAASLNFSHGDFTHFVKSIGEGKQAEFKAVPKVTNSPDWDVYN